MELRCVVMVVLNGDLMVSGNMLEMAIFAGVSSTKGQLMETMHCAHELLMMVINDKLMMINAE